MTVAAGVAPAGRSTSVMHGFFRRFAVPLLIALVYLNLSETLVRFHGFPSVLQALVVALTFFAWLERDTASPRRVALQPLTIALAVYLLVAFASTSWALDQEVADTVVVRLLKAFAIYVLATLLMFTRGRLRSGIVAMIAAAALIGLLILYQVATGSFDDEFGGLARVKDAHIYGDVFQARVAGPIGDPNFFARMLLLPIPPAVMLAFRARVRWQRHAALAATAIILATIATTYSRGAMLALAAMALMLLHALHVRWRTTFAIGAALLFILILLPPSVTERFVTIEQILPRDEVPLNPDSSFEERKLLMTVAWVMFGAHPAGGVGIGNYTTRYEDYVGWTGSAIRAYTDPSDLQFPHNLALEVAAETGILGVVTFAAVIVIAWRAFRRAARALADDRELASLATALSISLAGWLVAGLFLHLSEPRTLLLLLAFAATFERLGDDAQCDVPAAAREATA